MNKYDIAHIDEIPPGARKIVCVNGRDIGIFHVSGRFYALQNICPHQGAPVCLGEIAGTNRPSRPDCYEWDRSGEILRCPWHGWEFDLLNGRSLFDQNVRLKMYPTHVVGERILVEF